MVIMFVEWSQCDICQHWCHLQFCVPQKSVKKNEKFECPCHVSARLTQEE
jgi:hypothetical protein